MVQLALDTVRLFTDEPLMIDFGHAGALKSILAKQPTEFQAKALDALARKDSDAVATLEQTILRFRYSRTRMVSWMQFLGVVRKSSF